MNLVQSCGCINFNLVVHSAEQIKHFDNIRMHGTTVNKINICTYSNYTQAAATCSAAQQHTNCPADVFWSGVLLVAWCCMYVYIDIDNHIKCTLLAASAVSQFDSDNAQLDITKLSDFEILRTEGQPKYPQSQVLVCKKCFCKIPNFAVMYWQFS
jgi:hypothetical protein